MEPIRTRLLSVREVQVALEIPLPAHRVTTVVSVVSEMAAKEEMLPVQAVPAVPADQVPTIRLAALAETVQLLELVPVVAVVEMLRHSVAVPAAVAVRQQAVRLSSLTKDKEIIKKNPH